MTSSARRTAYGTVSTALALLSDERLAELVHAARPIGVGIGGTSALLEVEGVPVFAKRVPLTDLERRPGNVMSTANVFGLPAICHYGIGSPGFGVWRELAAHVMTTGWVLGDQSRAFPLMYHWRVLTDYASPLHEELRDVDGIVEYWGGSTALRERVEALRTASASVVLFLEYVPRNLHEWFTEQIEEGGEAAEAACAMVERRLRTGTGFMNARGLLHFDAHFENILTDGRRLYFADFGLAASERFELAAEESDFLAEHWSYDRCYTVTHLVHWLAAEVYGHRGDDDDWVEFVRACAQGAEPGGSVATAAAIVKRYAPIAVVMNGFYRELQRETRMAHYPVEAIRRVLDAVGVGVR